MCKRNSCDPCRSSRRNFIDNRFLERRFDIDFDRRFERFSVDPLLSFRDNTRSIDFVLYQHLYYMSIYKKIYYL